MPPAESTATRPVVGADVRTAVNADVADVAPGEFPALGIGRLAVWPPVVLAPMAGVTDTPFRTLCREFSLIGAGRLARVDPANATSPGADGGAARSDDGRDGPVECGAPGLFVNQMITARGLVERHAKTLKLAEFSPDESPRSIQLYGTDPGYLAAAVEQLLDADAVDHIDMNFGCPVPKVTRHGGGGALPWRRPLFARIVRAAVDAADGRVPVTVKFRVGIDDGHPTHLDAGRIARDEGASAVALHARTVEQLYSGAARWEEIGRLKRAVGDAIPVLGNGDIWEAHDAVRMMRATGADGVVIGRGCLGRPWLFADLARVFDGDSPAPRPDLGVIADTMRDHATRLVAWAGTEDALRGFRKHAVWYLTGLPVGGEIRRRLQQVGSLDELDAVIARLDRSAVLPLDALRMPRSHKGGPKSPALPEGWLDDPDADVALGADAEALVSGG